MAGIGYAWLFSQSLSCVVALIIARSFIVEKEEQWNQLKALIPAINQSSVELVRLAYPLILQDLSWFFSVAIIFRLIDWTIATKLSTPYHLLERTQAALSVGLKVDELLMAVFLYALISAARALISQRLGQGDLAGAGLLLGRFAKIGMAYGLCNALLYLVCADLIGQFLTGDIRECADFLRIVAFGQPFMAVFYVLCGGLQAYGRTLDSMLITIFAFVVIRLPLAWLFGQLWGVTGIWLSFPLSCMAGCLLAYYRTKWLLKQSQCD
jgi:Na+-driven multidrug efflux pump